MKKIIDQYSTADKIIRVDQYLIIFLKFMSSIMPSVDYDHTMTME
jgi:ubiquitin-like-conjugating enzyme ATG3